MNFEEKGKKFNIPMDYKNNPFASKAPQEEIKEELKQEIVFEYLPQNR